MQGQWLRDARAQKGWTQQEAAMRLGVSQAYLSLLERNLRRVSRQLLPRLQKRFEVPATELPVDTSTEQGSTQQVAEALGALGYPGFTYLKRSKRVNPAQVLLTALLMQNLETRLTDALPWVAWRYANLNWEWLFNRVKVRDAQNRLGFVLTLAREVAERKSDQATASRLAAAEQQLERSRLEREDTLCREAMTQAERRWLREHLPPAARHWHVLSDLKAEQLPYAT